MIEQGDAYHYSHHSTPALLPAGVQNAINIANGAEVAISYRDEDFVEVVRTVVSAPDVVEDAVALAQRLGKSPVTVGDKAGFIANALLFAYLNHAASMYEAQYATREDIDAAMRLGCGYDWDRLRFTMDEGLSNAVIETFVRLHDENLGVPRTGLLYRLWRGSHPDPADRIGFVRQ